MRIRNLLMISGGLVFSVPAGGFHAASTPAHYTAPRQAPLPAFNIVLLGMPSQNDRMRRWLAQIAQVPKGRQTLMRI